MFSSERDRCSKVNFKYFTIVFFPNLRYKTKLNVTALHANQFKRSVSYFESKSHKPHKLIPRIYSVLRQMRMIYIYLNIVKCNILSLFFFTSISYAWRIFLLIFRKNISTATNIGCGPTGLLVYYRVQCMPGHIHYSLF